MLRREDLRQLSYAELGSILDSLASKVRAFRDDGHPIDVVAPILRSGGITGGVLASRLDVARTLPLQYKYDAQGVPRRVFDLPLFVDSTAPVRGILIADTNTVRGGIATLAAHELRARFPEAAVYLASAVMDVSLGFVAGVDHLLYGTPSNEARCIGAAEARARGISDAVYVFPWEDADAQWEEILAASAHA